MRHLFFLIGRIVSYIFPQKLIQIIHILLTRFYTGYYSRYFKAFGSNSIIAPYVWSLRGPQYITIGNNVLIGGNIQLTAWGSNGNGSVSIIIGDGCSLGSNNHITAVKSISFGKNVLTGKNVTITDNSHGSTSYVDMNIPPKFRNIITKGEVVIGDNVWIGDKATILPGVHIGDGAIVGANSVVTCDVPPMCVAVGSPARIVKQININM